jgi:hypothetical protein
VDLKGTTIVVDGMGQQPMGGRGNETDQNGLGDIEPGKGGRLVHAGWGRMDQTRRG